MGRLIDAIDGTVVGLDTAVFVYFMEEHGVYAPVVEPVFDAVASGRLQAVTSELTLLETLVVPLRAGAQDLVDRYEALLTRSRGLTMVPLDRDVLKGAAQLRAVTRVKTPDALQLAAALQRGARTFITNDRRMPALPHLTVLQVRNFAADDA